MVKYGWVCPKCGRVYSEVVTECKHCNSLIDEETYRPTPTPEPMRIQPKKVIKTVPPAQETSNEKEVKEKETKVNQELSDFLNSLFVKLP